MTLLPLVLFVPLAAPRDLVLELPHPTPLDSFQPLWSMGDLDGDGDVDAVMTAGMDFDGKSKSDLIRLYKNQKAKQDLFDILNRESDQKLVFEIKVAEKSDDGQDINIHIDQNSDKSDPKTPSRAKILSKSSPQRTKPSAN